MSESGILDIVLVTEQGEKRRMKLNLMDSVRVGSGSEAENDRGLGRANFLYIKLYL